MGGKEAMTRQPLQPQCCRCSPGQGAGAHDTAKSIDPEGMSRKVPGSHGEVGSMVMPPLAEALRRWPAVFAVGILERNFDGPLFIPNGIDGKGRSLPFILYGIGSGDQAQRCA